jgi:hypothetical protein
MLFLHNVLAFSNTALQHTTQQTNATRTKLTCCIMPVADACACPPQQPTHKSIVDGTTISETTSKGTKAAHAPIHSQPREYCIGAHDAHNSAAQPRMTHNNTAMLLWQTRSGLETVRSPAKVKTSQGKGNHPQMMWFRQYNTTAGRMMLP